MVHSPDTGGCSFPGILAVRPPAMGLPAGRQARRTAMGRRHFETYAELDRQMNAARQLRAETLGGATFIVSALAAALGAIRGLLPRITARTSSQA
jgi:hypothetical protein